MEQNNKHKRKTAGIIALIVAAVLVCAAVAGVLLLRSSLRQAAVINAANTAGGTEQTGEAAADYGLDAAKAHVKAIKASLKKLLACIKKENLDGADSALAEFDQNLTALGVYLDTPVVKAAKLIPGVSGEISSAETLLSAAEEASSSILHPALALLREAPLSTLKAEGGLNVTVMLRYLDFAEEILPTGKKLVEELNGVELNYLDKDGKIAGYIDEMNTLMESLGSFEDVLPLVRTFLGNGGDRLYVFAAQNTAEIRSSGGFPGSVGTISIQNGVLRVGEFDSVYHVLQGPVSSEVGKLQEEKELFSDRITLSWDMDFCPNFELCGKTWAYAYRDKNKVMPDGVVSATPVIIQQLLAAVDKTVELSDGTLLTGENATKQLSRDLYFKYNSHGGSQWTLDPLFAEAAEGTLDAVIGELGLSTLPALVQVLQKDVADRVIQVWLADEAEQQLVVAAGWSGGLPHDAQKPTLGIFFGGVAAGKMGWWLDIEPEVTGSQQNADGSITYDVAVTFRNTMSQEEIRTAGNYIRMSYNGSILANIHLFAPEGGSISELSASDGSRYSEAEYDGLQVIYAMKRLIYPGQDVILSCKVTTAPGVSEPLSFTKTPTLTEYRDGGVK